VKTQRDSHQALGVNVLPPRSQSEVCGVFRRILMVTVKMTKVDLACDPALCAESVGKRANRGQAGKGAPHLPICRSSVLGPVRFKTFREEMNRSGLAAITEED
jgi:hypothetical protein